MARITFVCQLLTGLENIEKFSFINIKYVLRLLSIILGTSPLFQSNHRFGIYSGTISQNSLVYQVMYFLITDDPAILRPKTVDT